MCMRTTSRYIILAVAVKACRQYRACLHLGLSSVNQNQHLTVLAWLVVLTCDLIFIVFTLLLYVIERVYLPLLINCLSSSESPLIFTKRSLIFPRKMGTRCPYIFRLKLNGNPSPHFLLSLVSSFQSLDDVARYIHQTYIFCGASAISIDHGVLCSVAVQPPVSAHGGFFLNLTWRNDRLTWRNQVREFWEQRSFVPGGWAGC